MKRKFNYWMLFLIVFLALQSIDGQNIKKNDALFKLPEGYCLAVKVIQNNSPVQFENIDVLVEKNGKMPFLNWGLKNNSSKTVRRFVVAFKIRTNVEQWQMVSRREIAYDIGTDAKNDLILPNKIYQEVDYAKTNLLTQEIHNLFSSQKESDKKFIIVYGMIKKVVFDDGSIFEEDSDVFKEFF